jgi:hypothetical protein
MAAMICGIVINGPIPHICVMFTATAERNPNVRVKCGEEEEGTGGVDSVMRLLVNRPWRRVGDESVDSHPAIAHASSVATGILTKGYRT